VNGYQSLETMSGRWNEVVKSAGKTVDALKSLTDFNFGEMKFPETKIGEAVTKAEEWLSQKVEKLEARPPQPAQANPHLPPKPPLPPSVRPRPNLRMKLK
jgi:hypothetical protein